jgi:hypothetical protein
VLSAYESALLARFAAASLLSLVLSLKQLEAHNNSGSEGGNGEYVRFLHTLIFSNAVASSTQLCGAIIVSSLSLAGRDISAQVRQGIFMASLRIPSLQNLISTRPALLHSCCVTFLSLLIEFGVDLSSQQAIG